MALEDFMESEVAIAVAATAAVFSPPVRRVLRRGAVYGIAGALMAGDAIASFARGVGRGAQDVASSAVPIVQDAAEQAKTRATELVDGMQTGVREAEPGAAKRSRRGHEGPGHE